MAFAGQKVLHVWQPTQPLVIKYTLPLFAVFCSGAFCSAGFAAAIAPVALKSRGDAIAAADPATINFLLVILESFSVITFLLKIGFMLNQGSQNPDASPGNPNFLSIYYSFYTFRHFNNMFYNYVNFTPSLCF
jgi:hypothetical protein